MDVSSRSFEHTNCVVGLSKIIAEKIFLGKNHKHVFNPYYIDIPHSIALKWDLRDSDTLIWHYYHDKRAAIVTKREGWKSRTQFNVYEPQFGLVRIS